MIHFALFGDYERTPDLKRFAEGIQQEMEKHGFQRVPTDFPQLQLVLNFVDPNRPKPFRRKGNGTFVVSITEVDEPYRYPENRLSDLDPFTGKPDDFH